jgi:hypothetical protein
MKDLQIVKEHIVLAFVAYPHINVPIFGDINCGYGAEIMILQRAGRRTACISYHVKPAAYPFKLFIKYNPVDGGPGLPAALCRLAADEPRQ